MSNKDPITVIYRSNAKPPNLRNWIRTRTALEFIGVWEQMNNVHKDIEFGS